MSVLGPRTLGGGRLRDCPRWNQKQLSVEWHKFSCWWQLSKSFLASVFTILSGFGSSLCPGTRARMTSFLVLFGVSLKLFCRNQFLVDIPSQTLASDKRVTAWAMLWVLFSGVRVVIHHLGVWFSLFFFLFLVITFFIIIIVLIVVHHGSFEKCVVFCQHW